MSSAPKAHITKQHTRDLVVGNTTGSVDIQQPGMLHARILVSPCKHAAIKKIDISKASALPGIVAVLTHEDCPDDLKTNQRPLLTKEPQFIGDWIAAVSAESALIAEDALALIEIDFEPLPVEELLVPFSAMEVRQTSGSISVHFAGISSHQTRLDFKQRAAFVSTDDIDEAREKTDEAIDPLESLARLLARRSNRSVKLVEPDTADLYTRQLTSAHTVKIEADTAGIITGLHHLSTIYDGAYASRRENDSGNATLIGPLKTNKVETLVSRVRTNIAPAAEDGASVNHGGNFIVQQAVDAVAKEADLDPLELRIKNLPTDTDGERMAACLRAGAARFGWSRKWQGWNRNAASGERYRYGVGVSAFSRGTPNAFFGHQADFVEVEVDTETGFVILLDHLCAMDVTDLRSIPDKAQLQASFVRSIGNAILETQASDDHSHGLEQLHAPSIMDVLDVRYVFTGKLAEANAAFAHDPASAGSIDIAPTIANAIQDAVGARVHSLPLSAEKILAALKEKDAIASSFASAPNNIDKRGMQWNA